MGVAEVCGEVCVGGGRGDCVGRDTRVIQKEHPFFSCSTKINTQRQPRRGQLDKNKVK